MKHAKDQNVRAPEDTIPEQGGYPVVEERKPAGEKVHKNNEIEFIVRTT